MEWDALQKWEIVVNRHCGGLWQRYIQCFGFLKLTLKFDREPKTRTGTEVIGLEI